MSFNKISVVIPCYWANDHLIDTTEKCLLTLGQTASVDEVIVVDDGSPNKWPKAEIAMGSILVKERNGGYAAAVNKGMQKATGNVIIISNNDVEFIQHDWLTNLLEPLELGYDISCIRTTDADGWQTEQRITENDKFGSIWAITRSAYEKLGPMDERFGKGLFEDLDYWRRARDAGLRIAKNHAGLVEHKGKQTFKIVDPDDELFGTNMFIYKQKWGEKAHIIETKPNAILMVDDYELEQATQSEREEYFRKEVSLEEAERRWGVKV